MTQAESVEPHVSRYHITKPPPKLHAILTEFAKLTRGAVYRAHGGYPDNGAIRSTVTNAVGDTPRGDADDIGRFLKKHGVLCESTAGGWTFDAEKADELFASCTDDGSLSRGGRSFVDMCERASDPGSAPAIPGPSTAATDAGPSTASVPAKPKLGFLDFDDELLALHRDELVAKRDEIERELAGVNVEIQRRAEQSRLETELAELDAEEQRLKGELHGVEERRLEIAAKRRALATYTV